MSDSDDATGPVVTVFRSTLRPEAVDDYEAVSERMVALAGTMPGLLDYKTFASADGERVTLVTFASVADHRAWRDHPEHRQAQILGQEHFYQSYVIQVCTGVSERRFSH